MKYFLLLFFLISISLYSENFSSIKSILDNTTYKYTRDSDGDFVIEYTTNTGRTQSVIIRNNTNEFQNVEIREIISIAKTFKNRVVPDKLTNYLLIDNYSSKYLGNWAIHKKDDISTILFIVKLPYNIDNFFLDAAIIESAEAADALEKALEDEIENIEE